MVNVILTNQRLREVHFVNHIDQSGQVQLTSNFSFHVDYAKDNTRCVAKLYQSAQLKDDPEKLFVSGEIVGNFTLQGVVDETTKREAHIQCYNQLFPYLQCAVSQLASASGLPGFLMKKNLMTPDQINFAKHQPPTPTLPIV